MELIRNGYIGNLKEMQINLPTIERHHDAVRSLRGTTPEAKPVPDGPELGYVAGLHT